MRWIGPGLGVIPSAARPAPTTAPVNVVPPSIAGVLTEGEVGTVDPGEWEGLPGPLFTYQWTRNGSPIPGATGPTHPFNTDDVAAGPGAIGVEVTATNDVGSTTASSATVTIRPPLQVTGLPPSATVGAPYVHAFAIQGGHGPYVGALTGTLPPGLSFDGVDVEIGGIPVSTGAASGLSLIVTDADGLTATLGPFSINVTVGDGPNAQLTLASAANSGFMHFLGYN